ncbi:MAG: choice-of-anchor Q domain-containing protein [Anaerolineae bacterium]|nr:choice-of-anchor Q domain-containing protein [Anaerolineae bacterium]
MRSATILFSTVIVLFAAFTFLPYQTVAAATFQVDSPLDSHDANPGDGTCADTGNHCTLRAAIEEANALAGADEINLPAFTYNISMGEIDIKTDVTIHGASESNTILVGASYGGARGFDVWADALLTLDYVTMKEFQRAISYAGTADISDTTFTLNSSGSCGAIGGEGVLSLTRVTIFQNQATSQDGGGACLGGDVTVDSSTISANSAARNGGGLHINRYAQVTMTNSIVANNQSDQNGAGIYLNDDADLDIDFVDIYANNAIGNGGGIAHGGNTLAIQNSTLYNNQAGSAGGAIFNISTMNFSFTSITGNSAGAAGGGISDDRTSGTGWVYLTNTTISGNNADTNGGGIFSNSGTMKVFSSTITNNTADADGNNDGEAGGVYRADSASSGDLTIKNTIIAENQDASTGDFAVVVTDCDADLVSAGFNLIGVGQGTGRCSITGDLSGNQVGSTVSPIDPLLEPLGKNGYYTYHHDLLDGSPAIDAGDPDGCTYPSRSALYDDQRGEPRVVGSRCDIGSIESFLGKWWLYLPLIVR